jgi:hypothetical protein
MTGFRFVGFGNNRAGHMLAIYKSLHKVRISREYTHLKIKQYYSEFYSDYVAGT